MSRELLRQAANALHGVYTAENDNSDVFAAIEAIEAELAKPEQGEVWLPIETAPRYGRILVTGTDIGACVASAGWDNETPEKIRWGVVNDIEVTPTHWMSLPKLPTTGESK
jgi:hypothetical protein